MKRKLDLFEYNDNDGVGRLRTATPSQEIAIAEKLEANMMTKAQFNALAEERKANRAGSGWDEMGKHSVGYSSVNNGIICAANADYINAFQLGWNFTSQLAGDSKTNYPLANVNGVLHKLFSINRSTTSYEINKIILPTAPNIYPYDTVLTTEQIASGVIKHADASNSGLIVNGKFNTDTSGWTYTSGVFTQENGSLKIGSLSGEAGRGYQVIPTVVGKTYTIEINMTNISLTQLFRIFINTSNSTSSPIASINYDSDGRKSLTFVATSTTTYIIMLGQALASGYGYIDNIAVYPADAISRSDLVFLESWHEDVSEKNFVYPLGNVQYLGGNTDGLTGIANGAFTGFETYSLKGNWQTPSALIGKGYIWSNLTETQKRAFIANPDNNCYLDGDKTIQVRYRVRVVMGVGDSWEITPTYYNTALQYNSSLLVKPKGKNTSIVSDLGTSTGGVYAGFLHVFTDGISFINGDYGVVQASSGVDVLFSGAYEGKCFALPIALVHR